ncbi:MAG: HRDC domain-containing protein [Acidobacteriota bacterium]
MVTPQRDLDLLAAVAPASRADLDRIDSLRSWRRRIFGDEWLAVLAGK